MGISLETQQLLMPYALRERYGDRIGNEVWQLTRIVKKEDEAVLILLAELDALDHEERKFECITAIWDAYYNQLAEQIIEKKEHENESNYAI